MTVNNLRVSLLALLLGCSAMLTSSSALALRPNEAYVTTYYSDATQSIEIGWQKRGYCGPNYDHGVHSPYFTMEIEGCGGPVVQRAPKIGAEWAEWTYHDASGNIVGGKRIECDGLEVRWGESYPDGAGGRIDYRVYICH